MAPVVTAFPAVDVIKRRPVIQNRGETDSANGIESQFGTMVMTSGVRTAGSRQLAVVAGRF